MTTVVKVPRFASRSSRSADDTLHHHQMKVGGRAMAWAEPSEALGRALRGWTGPPDSGPAGPARIRRR